MGKRVIVVLLAIGQLIDGAIGGWAAIHQLHMIAALEALKKAQMELNWRSTTRADTVKKLLSLCIKLLSRLRKALRPAKKKDNYGDWTTSYGSMSNRFYIL